MYEIFYAPTTGDYIAISNLIVGAILFFFNCGPFVFQEHREFNKKLNELKEKAEKLKEEEEVEGTGPGDDTSINKGAAPSAKSFIQMPTRNASYTL